MHLKAGLRNEIQLWCELGWFWLTWSHTILATLCHSAICIASYSMLAANYVECGSLMGNTGLIIVPDLPAMPCQICYIIRAVL